MSQLGLVKNYTAEGVIAKNRIVKFGAADKQIAQASAATDNFAGVTGVNGADGAGDRVDIYKTDIQDIEFGGTVAAGDPLTADADGKAIKAAPTAGSNVRCIGTAEVSAVSGDIAPAHISPFIMQG